MSGLAPARLPPHSAFPPCGARFDLLLEEAAAGPGGGRAPACGIWHALKAADGSAARVAARIRARCS